MHYFKQEMCLIYEVQSQMYYNFFFPFQVLCIRATKFDYNIRYDETKKTNDHRRKGAGEILISA